MNVRNSFKLKGRVAGTPKTIDHPDGGRTIKIDLAVRNNYKTRDGSDTFETLPIAVYRSPDAVADPKRGSGPAGTLQEDDVIAVCGSVRNNNWVDTMGHTHYELVLQVETLDVLAQGGENKT